MGESSGQPFGRTDPADWVDAHGDALYRYARLHLRDEAAAEDAVQETLLAGIRGRDRFKGDASERTWLIGILKRKVIDHIRRKERQPTLLDLQGTESYVDDHFNAKGLWQESVRKWGRNPHGSAESSEFWDVLNRCLAGLPDRFAAAFTLRELDNTESDDICKILDLTPTNLWTILHRARARLRDCLERNWFVRGS